MSQDNQQKYPQALSRRIRFPLVWVIPILVALLALYLGWKAILNNGPEITVSFETADGIISGQTQVKNKSVVLGTVQNVSLTKDMRRVNVRIAMTSKARSILTKNARFWVVRPRFNGTNISGLETLFSGAYIAVDPGKGGGEKQRYFVGLETPPGLRSDQPGNVYKLATENLGSLGPGAPIFYRDTIAGEVLDYTMPPKGVGPIILNIFLKEPYNHFLHPNTRFWNVSGIKIGFGPGGMNIELQSIQALMSGGIAFGTVGDLKNSSKTEYTPSSEVPFALYKDKDTAEDSFYRETVPLVTYVASSVKGLGEGSKVTLFGLQIGTVRQVSLLIDRKASKTQARIEMEIQPERVFSFHKKYDVATLTSITKALVANGLRASVTSDNMIMGTSLVALNFVKNSPYSVPQMENNAILIPSQPGGMDNIMASFSTVASRIAAMPLDQIGDNLNNLLSHTDHQLNSPDMKKSLKALRASMENLSQLTRKTNAGVSPLLKQLPEMSRQLDNTLKNANMLLASYGGDTDFHRDLQDMIVQLSQAARSLRFLSDFMTQHPSAIITGRKP
ncbi:MAG: intermembrane transport protein PqiB [Commensalibacter sp.]